MTRRHYMKMAFPFVFATITQPLLGAVDTAIVGHLGDITLIGGVAIGSVIYNTIYWLFGFLRVSTSGFSAQAYGKKSSSDSYLSYLRPFFIAAFIGTLIVMMQSEIRAGAFLIYRPSADVVGHATAYFNILIYGAPIVLIGYVNIGWLMGQKCIKETVFLQVSMNVLNIVLDFLLVMKFNMGVSGVAIATLISQSYGFVFGFIYILTKLKFETITNYITSIFDKSAIYNLLNVNRDLFIRTLCLLIMTNLFMSKSADFGDHILAANAVLFQLQYIIAYFFDGFANASSIFAGEFIGQRNAFAFKQLLILSKRTSTQLAITLAIAVIVFGHGMLKIMTSQTLVIDIASHYILWLVAFTASISYGLVLYGVYTGATDTAPIRRSMMVSLFAFLLGYFVVVPQFGNHGLWFSFISFSLSRSLYLIYDQRQLIHRHFIIIE